MSAIHNNTQESRYEWSVDGQVAVADYQLEGDKLILNRVYVPGELRGKGIAAQIMKAVVEDAEKRGLTLVPVCSYAAAYVQRQK